MITKEKKSVPQTTTEPQDGAFLPIISTKTDWVYCRETFWNYWKGQHDPKTEVEAFFFHLKNANSAGVIKFIEKVEKQILELKEESAFALTPRNNVIWVKPTDFWQSCPMRRSFFTALLRAGRAYQIDVDNFEEAMYSDKYLKETKNAVMRFLFGFTRFNAEAGKSLLGLNCTYNQGWWAFFQNRDVSVIRKILNHTKSDYTAVAIGAEQLWT